MKYSLRILALLALISLNLARSTTDDSESGLNEEEGTVGTPEAKSGYESQGYGYEQQSPQVFFGGQYGGRCDQDGFYFNDENSFIMCNHGIAYAQQCAPGTRNNMATQNRAGGFYSHTAFCDVNLVDFGYAAFHSQRGRGSGGRGGGSGYGSSNSGGGYGHQAMTMGYKPSGGSSSGYGQSSYNSQSYGGMQHGNQGYGSSRYGSYAPPKATTSYTQPTYQVYAYRPSYTSYKQQPSYQTTYRQKPQGHSAYGRKYSGYYTQRRYHTQPAMKY